MVLSPSRSEPSDGGQRKPRSPSDPVGSEEDNNLCENVYCHCHTTGSTRPGYPCAAGPVSGRCQVAPFRPSGYHSRTRGLAKIPAALAGEARKSVQLFDSIKGESRMRSQPDIDYDALVKEDRVHISLYTAPEIFTDEMDKIFHRGWVYVGHQGEVPNPGDFRLKRIGLQPVIMVRDQRGVVQLLLNRCRHRGATVCQE